MKRLLLTSILAIAFGSAIADELQDAAKLLENKDYARAVQQYSKLAEAGNIEAQLQLGDMYGFGDGVPENAEQAAFWLNKAAAKGNKDAIASLQTLQQRATRKADILYYTSKYDGADIKLSQFACQKPELPIVSSSKDEVLKLDAATKAWFDCYGRFTGKLNQSLPPGKAIPAEVVSVMSNAEFKQASMTMDKAYAAISLDAEKQANDLRLKHQQWITATEANFKSIAAKTKIEMELMARARAAAQSNRVDATENSGGGGGGRK